jgi:hypothetical protein
MATTSQLTALKQLYSGIFGFFPTTEAFDWYTAQIDQLELDTAGLANVLLFDDTQPGASNTFDYSNGDTAFVRQVYKSLFGWTDAALTLPVHVEGVAYWTNQLNGVFGGDKGRLVETMLWVVETNGPSSPDVSTRQAFALLQNYVEVSTYALAREAATEKELTRDVLRAAHSAIDSDDASVDTAKAIIDGGAPGNEEVLPLSIEDETVDWLLERYPDRVYAQALTEDDGVFFEDILYVKVSENPLPGDDPDETAGYIQIGSDEHPGNSRILVGGDGPNLLKSFEGYNLLIGGESKDLFTGDAAPGHDILYGGKGNDRFVNLGGDDIYVFTRGDGVDSLLDALGKDIILFGEGIHVGDVRLSKATSAPHLVLHYTDEDRVEVRNQSGGTKDVERGYTIEELQFREGDATVDFMGVVTAFYASWDAGNLQADVEYAITSFL